MIDRQDTDGIAVLHLRHGKANAFDIELLEHLDSVLVELSEDESVRAVVVTGNGRMFSAGVDLVRVHDGGADYLERFLPALSRALDTLFLLPLPVVAAVDGHAIAGGLIVAMSADRVLMARGEGKVGLTELRVGVPFPGIPLEVVRYRLGNLATEALVYEAGLVDAEEAERRKLVDRLVAPEDLLLEAIVAAGGLAKLPRQAFALSKRQLRGSAMARAADHDDDAVLGLWCSPRAQTAIGQFLARSLGKRSARES